MTHNGKVVYIRKSTAIWLFQECERVSSDRLFRVRAVQPNSLGTQVNLPETKQMIVETLPKKCEILSVGDICVFQTPQCIEWKVGKVLQFFYPSEKTSKAQQCKETSIKLNNIGKNTAVVCAWFTWHIPLSLRTFVFSANPTSHYCLINEYAFTLSKGCFDVLHIEGSFEYDHQNSSIMVQNTTQLELVCAKFLTISEESMLFLEENLRRSNRNNECCNENTAVTNSSINSMVSSRTTSRTNTIWRKYGCYTLTILHKSHLCSDQLLDDYHIGAAQALLQRQFPHIGGFRNTVIQDTESLQPFTEQHNLQIIHVKMVRTDHWIVISTVNCAEGEVEVYDSLQLSPDLHTQTVIAKYLKSKLHSIRIKVANVATQKGSSDCGLYCIAMMTSLANNDDPVNVVYNQQEMRIHLRQCFENGVMEKFPISKARRMKKRILKEIICLIYCKCRLPEPDDNSNMVQCDKCQEWFHIKCFDLNLQELANNDHDWFCSNCSS